MSSLRVISNDDQDKPAEPNEIRRALQHLIGSFPNSSKKEYLSIYGITLFDDVVATKPSLGTLDKACRRLRWSSEFLPSIKAVLDALEAVKSETVSLVDTAPLGEPGKLLLRRFGPAVFHSWMSKLTVVDQRGAELILSAPSAFVRSRILRDFADDILRYWQLTNQTIKKLEVIVTT